MKIKPFTLGIGYTNSYVVYFDDRRAYLIDAPDNLKAVFKFINDNGLKLEAVLLTHGHYDHILGLPEIRASYPNIDIYLDKADFCFIEDGASANIDILQGDRLLDYYRDAFKAMPDDIKLLGHTFNELEVISTPGHTLGSVCLYSKEEKVLFSGDTLFRSGVGRWDLGGSYSDLLSSLDKLKALPDETAVFPGHGSFTTLADEKRSNPYF